MGLFSVWIAVGFSGSRPPDFKIYLNPRAQGPSLASAVVEEALARLGFPKAWPVISRHLLRRGPDLDELNYVSLDLSSSLDARLKIYARHASCSPDDLELAACAALSHRAGDVKEFLGLVAPDAGKVFEGRAPSTCYTFLGHEGNLPVAATTHFPINSYAPDDGVIAHRVLATLGRFGIPAESYARSVAAFATRPLDLGIGMHSYVSFRRYRGDPRLTTYLAVEAHKPGTVECSGAGSGESGVIEAAARTNRSDVITDHPFCRRVRREPPDSQHLDLILANIAVANRQTDATSMRSGTRGEDASIWAVVDRHVCTAGESVVKEARRLMALLPEASSMPPGAHGPKQGQSLTPGHLLQRRVATILNALDPHEVTGAATAASTIGKRLARLVGDAMDVRSEPTQAATAGDTESFASDTPVPARARAATWRGESEVARAAWQFLDDLYALCYGDAFRLASPSSETPHVGGG